MKYILVLFILVCHPAFAQNTNNTNNLVKPVDSISVSNNVNETNTGFLDDFYMGQNAPQAVQTTDGENFFFTILRVAFITGILGFLTWLVLKYFYRKNAVSVTSTGNPIEILATVPAGLGVYFVVAKMHTLYYLMSLSSDGLHLIDKITDKEAIDFLEVNKDITIPAHTKFVDLLQKIPEGKPKQALEFLRDKIEQLRKK